MKSFICCWHVIRSVWENTVRTVDSVELDIVTSRAHADRIRAMASRMRAAGPRYTCNIGSLALYPFMLQQLRDQQWH